MELGKEKAANEKKTWPTTPLLSLRSLLLEKEREKCEIVIGGKENISKLSIIIVDAQFVF